MGNLSTLLATYKAANAVVVICNTCHFLVGCCTPNSDTYTADITMIAGEWSKRCIRCGSLNLTIS